MCAERRRAAPLAALAALAACAFSVAAPPTVDTKLPIKIVAADLDADLRNNLVTYHKVTISQGDLSIAADTGTTTGENAQDTRWDFHGNVRITLPDGFMAGDAAMVQFARSAISTAQISGAPATFEQKRDNCVARGHAGRLDFDFTADTVRLSEQAGITYGEGEINGRTLVYSNREQRVLASPQDQGDQQVHIVINPGTTPAPAGAKKCGR